MNNKSMWLMMGAATKRARTARLMATVTRVAGDKEGKGDGVKGDGDGNMSV